MVSDPCLHEDKGRREIKVETDWAAALKLVPSSLSARQIGDKEAWLVEGLFTEEECSKLIGEAECHGFGKTNYPQEYRGNLRLITSDPNFTEAVQGRLEPLVPSSVTLDGNEWDFCGLNECWRLAKYYAGHRFGRHCDEPYRRSEEEMSMFTVNIYMNSGFGGGDTRFYFSWDPQRADVSVEPRAGLCVIFRQPPEQRYYHDGEEVSSGVKYLFRTDVMYRRRQGAREQSLEDPLVDEKKCQEPMTEVHTAKKKSRGGGGDGKQKKGKAAKESRNDGAPVCIGLLARQAAYTTQMHQFIAFQQAVYAHQAVIWGSPNGDCLRTVKRQHEGTIKSMVAKGHGFIECAQTNHLHNCDIYIDRATVPKGAVVGSRVIFTVITNFGEHPKAATAYLA